MRKLNLAATLITFVSVFTFTQLACQRAAETNRSDSVPPPNTKPETVDTAAIEAELLRIERDWPRVLKERDVATVGRIEADDAVFVYPDGSVGNKEKDLADVSNGAMTADDIEMSDLTVKVLDNDAAVVIGQTEIKNGKFKMPDGKTSDISGKYRFVDTFARRGSEWKLVAGVTTRVTATATTASTTSATPATTPVTRPSPATSPAVRPPAAVKPSAAISPVMRASPATPRSTP